MNRRSFLAHAATGLAVGALGANERLEARPAARDASGTSRKLIDTERAGIIEAMRSEGVEGTSVCLIENGKAVWVEGFGTTGGRAPVDVNDQTIFSIQSTSKNFTAVCILLAVQEGLLDLDVPISRYLPGFRVNSRFESKPQDRITLRLLLSHRAGFTHEAPIGNNYEPFAHDFTAHVKSISDTWLRYPVGERYRYSNLGFDLAGFILEQKTGMQYNQWLTRKLFTPLGMQDSTAEPGYYLVNPNRAIGHEKGYENFVPGVSPLLASGGIYTSARDMARYASFHLDSGRSHGKAVLDPAVWREMHRFSLGGDYGLGVIRNDVRYGKTPIRVLSHKGGGFGFGCVFIYCPEAQLAWAAMFNRPVSAPYRFGRKLMDGLLAARYGARTPRLSTADIAAVQPTPVVKRQLAGNYVGRNLAVRIGSTDDGLQFDSDALEVHGPLLAVSPTAFYTADSDRELLAWTFTDARGDLPAHLECSEGEAGVDYNEGPHDAKGPDRATWAHYPGKYKIFQWGRPAVDVLVDKRNGYLFINGVKLVVEREPGLFFTSDGEVVDFRASVPTWRNLMLRRA